MDSPPSPLEELGVKGRGSLESPPGPDAGLLGTVPSLPGRSSEALGLKGMGTGMGIGTGKGTITGYGTSSVGGGTKGASEGRPKFIMGGTGSGPAGIMLTGGKGRPGMWAPG